jgi:hypothetical protein
MTNETNKTNDYNLLREFNLKQAQAGAAIVCVMITTRIYEYEVNDAIFLGITTNHSEVFIQDEYGEGYCRHVSRIKMKPLAWVEGKPVYKGDVLYYTYQDGSFDVFTVEGTMQTLCNAPALLDCNTGAWAGLSELTWTKPKKKHIHQELMDAHKAGAKIQAFNTQGDYVDITWEPNWDRETKYRIKPQKKSGWVNLWKSNKDNFVTLGPNVFELKELAELVVKDRDDLTPLATIEIHWEE